MLPTQDPISHEMLYNQVILMKSTLDEHVERAKESREDVREIRRNLDAGAGMFKIMGETVAEMRTTLAAVVKLQDGHDVSIRSLEAKENVRAGASGVWKAITSSKPVLWFLGTLSALVAALFHKGDLQ